MARDPCRGVGRSAASPMYLSLATQCTAVTKCSVGHLGVSREQLSCERSVYQLLTATASQQGCTS